MNNIIEKTVKAKNN